MGKLLHATARRLPAFVAGLLACTAVASAATGGFGPPTDDPPHAATFGSRTLRLGMKGDDVRVLNAIVRSKPFGSDVRLADVFESPTRRGVRSFQQLHDLRSTGVVDRATARALARSLRTAGATWYGPGLYGNTTACGQTLRRWTVGVAHKTLPCGTVVTIAFRGRFLVTRVIDRGPYHEGYSWDLTNGARKPLGFEGAEDVRYAVAR